MGSIKSLKTKKIFIIGSLIMSFAVLVCFVIFIVLACFDGFKFNEPISHKWIIAIIFSIIWFISLLVFLGLFCSYNCYFPLNSLKEYLITFRLENVGTISNDKLIINIKQVEKGVFKTTNGKNTLLFNLKGYLFPKSYLISYFLRNFSYMQINKNKIKLRKITSNLRLSFMDAYSNVELNIDNKSFVIVKNKKIKQTIISSAITYSPFYTILLPPYLFWDIGFDKYKKIDEKKYFEYKYHHINKD